MAAPDGASVRVAGALRGAVQVTSLDGPTSALRAECARLLGVEPATVKLIAAGRTLQDDAKLLCEYGLTAASRVLVTKGAAGAAAGGGAGSLSAEEARAAAEQARAEHLDRLRAAAAKISGRDGRGLSDKYEFSLENQAGARLALSESDRRALVLGLALHEKGRDSLAAGQLQDALGELLLAEESLGVVSSAVLEGVDNRAMLLLDIVWCCYKLRDVSRLGVCADRLASARRMLERAHGPHQERLRRLHGNYSPEAATYVRLELLEGVVAWHSGDADAARRHLAAAQARWQRLQLPETALLQLAEMGYSGVEASRALRFSSGNLGAAVEFLTEQRAKQQERRAELKRQREWQSERSKYGRTPGGRFVDGEVLAQLCSLGYEKALAAEALRQAENDTQAALDVLCDPVRRGALQLAIIAEQLREHQGATGGDAPSSSGVQAAAAARDAGGSGRRQRRRQRGGGGAAAAAAGGAAEADAGGADGGGSRDGSGSQSGSEEDEEAEAELVAAVRSKSKEDPLAAYDMDVAEEGDAIQVYMSLLASAAGEAAGASGSGQQAR